MSQGQPRLIRMATVAAAGASCLAAAACGPSASSGASAASTLSAAPSTSRSLTFSPAPRASASATAGSANSASDPLAGLTGGQVEARALANLKAEPSLTLAGTNNESGQDVSYHIGLRPGQGCTGEISEGSKGSFKFILIGTTLYFNADDTFWKAAVKTNASGVIALIDGRYIKTSATGSMASVHSLCNLAQTVGSAPVAETLIKGPRTMLGGALVLPLMSPAGGGTIDVTDTSAPELVAINIPGKLKATFSPDAPVTLAAPPPSEVIDGSQLGT